MKYSSWLVFFAAFLFVACDNEVVFEANTPIEMGKWKSENGASYEFDIKDTVKLHNFYINLRNGEEYAYSNIFLFIEMEFPNGKKSVDTLECTLAAPDGQWYGSGLGDIYDNRIIYKERKQFPLEGHYKVNIQHAMRTDVLEGIYDIGFRVASASN
jgi:gliding motility-associated lipoprotein GldH